MRWILLLLLLAACAPDVAPSPATSPSVPSPSVASPSDTTHAPPIVVARPSPGAELAPTFKLSGTANVFEATVSYRVVGDDGAVLKKGFTTASCGSGCRGDYSVTITVDVLGPTEATIEVFESSAEDGSPLHKVSIPVSIVP